MANKNLSDVVYVHAAAQNCVPSAIAPAPYAAGDKVRVDRSDGTTIDVVLTEADIGRGKFQGTAEDTKSADVEVGDVVTFYFV